MSKCRVVPPPKPGKKSPLLGVESRLGTNASAPLSLHECATIAEEVENDLDRISAVLDLHAEHAVCDEPEIELMASNLRRLARLLEPVPGAIHEQLRRSA